MVILKKYFQNVFEGIFLTNAWQVLSVAPAFKNAAERFVV